MGIENRGFASMDPAKQREIARQGGRVAHQKGVAHRWTKHEAREVGRKGGLVSQRNRRARVHRGDREVRSVTVDSDGGQS